MNGDVPTLLTERLLLTVPGASAAEAWVRFHNENAAHLAPWNPRMTARHSEVTAAADALAGDLEAAHKGARYRFLIFDRRGGGPMLGYLHFSEIVRGVFLACYLGYALAADAQGKGYMSEAARAGIDFMFSEVGLHRIMANYMPDNVRSAAVLSRLGFVVEGTAKDYLFLAGAWQDHVLTSLTNSEPVVPVPI